MSTKRSDEEKKEQTYEKFPGLPKVFRWLILVLWIIVLFTVYEVCITYNFSPIVYIYGAIFGICLLAYGVANRGFSRQILDPSNLPEGMSEKEKNEYILKQKKRESIGKMFLFPVIAVLVTFAFDLIYMFFN